MRAGAGCGVGGGGGGGGGRDDGVYNMTGLLLFFHFI